MYLNVVYKGANSTVHSATYRAYSRVIRSVCAVVTLGILVTLLAADPGPYNQYCHPLDMEILGVRGRLAAIIKGSVFA